MYVYQLGKRTTKKKSLHDLMELAMLKMVYSDLDNYQTPKDPDEIQCTLSSWQKFVWSAPSSHASMVTAKNWIDGKPTSNLVAQVCELQGNTIAKRRSPRKITAPVSVGQSCRGSRRANVTSGHDEGTSAFRLHKLNDRYSNQD